MLRSIFVFFLVAMLQLPSNAAITPQVGSNYTGFNFTVDQTGTNGWYASDYTKLNLDINGLGGSGNFAVYGALNCNGGSYGVNGSGFLTPGVVVLNLFVTGTIWVCNLNTNTLSGNCTLTSSNISKGTTTIAFKP
jgi:hypothetical protein